MTEVPTEHCLTRKRVDPLVLNYAGGYTRTARLPNGRVVVITIVGLVICACGLLMLAAVVRRPLVARQRLATTGPALARIVAMQILGFRQDMGRLPTDLEELFTPPPTVEAAHRWEGPYLESREALHAADDSRVQYHVYRSAEDGKLHFRVTAGASNLTHQSIDDRASRLAR